MNIVVRQKAQHRQQLAPALTAPARIAVAQTAQIVTVMKVAAIAAIPSAVRVAVRSK